MIIGIDGNEANVGKRVGISEFAFQLITEFAKLEKKDPAMQVRVYLKSVPTAGMPKGDSEWRYSVVGPEKLWTQVGLPLNLFIDFPRPDVFFSPTHYAPRFSPIPTAVSVMDLSYLFYPEMFRKSDLYQLKNWTAYSVKGAKAIITISESSKNDIIKAYSVSPDSVHVVYPGIKKELRIMNSHYAKATRDKQELRGEIMEKYQINKPYVLFVGTLQPRKNIERLIEAMSLVKEKDLELVIVGKKGWLFEPILAAPKKYGVLEKVKFLDYVSDEDLPALYQNAECFVLPSLYEGFGLPVLEAMQHGCPVITSNISSLPEAGGDAALYVDPMNASDIAEKISLVLTDKKLAASMVEKGYKQVKKFSWEKSAEKVFSVLQDIAKS